MKTTIYICVKKLLKDVNLLIKMKRLKLILCVYYDQFSFICQVEENFDETKFNSNDVE